MKYIPEIIKTLIIVVSLTVLTQVGGLVYLFYKPIGLKIKKNFISFKSVGLRLISFSAIYLFVCLIIVPALARPSGRVPMPVMARDNIRPASFVTWLLNRHYVDPKLKNLLEETASQLPGDLMMVYLDANFPFLDGFPLWPHLSHDDGKKIDLAFIYSNNQGVHLNGAKSLLGYGVVEEPLPNEFNQPGICREKGYWQYSLIANITWQNRHSDYKFDSEANADLVNKLANNSKTGKIFIEPHLKKRLKLTHHKLRFHGCQAVRHDDHIHVQL